MSHPGSAPCPPAFAPGAGGPPSIVVVQIISIKPNTDLEGDDDYVPFYDNHADIYGFVTIAGETFDLPQIHETDFPHWEAHGPRNGVFEKAVTSSPVPIRIDIWEGDSGLTGDDDHVDICPAGDKRHLDFEFDLCGLTVTGDINGSSQGLIQVSGGSGGEAATMTFRVGLKDGRPVTKDDLALVDLDLIQVTPTTCRMVARKGTVVMVRIANNHSVRIDTTLRMRITGGGTVVDKTFPLQIEAGEVKKEYLFADQPIMFPPGQAASPISVIAEIVDPGSAGLPATDCRLGNDRILNRTTWKVVTTDTNFSLLWAKVGSLLDLGNYTPDGEFNEIAELGTGYIRAVFPLIGPSTSNAPLGIPPPPITAAADYVVTILSTFGLPADAAQPVALTFELNGVAALLPYDRLMGVLPNKGWFKQFSSWSDVTGFSLGEFMSRAVIFLPRYDDGVPWTLPAHELGHTFGLSTDSRLKSSWVCDIDWPVVGHAACGLVGGFDEYEHDDPDLKDGNPASGYWVQRGSEPAALAPLANQEQCNSHCVMGSSLANPQDDWPGKGRWIDLADYNRLIDALVLHPDPEVVYVSGMISWHNQIHLGRCVRFGNGVPDHRGNRGMYGFRFIDAAGRRLSEVGLPVAWNHAEFRRVMPITFFGVTLELPESSSTLEIWNRGTGTLLASIDLSRSVPEISLDYVDTRDPASARLRWSARDREGSALSYMVTVGPDEHTRFPAAYGLTAPEFMLDTSTLAPGDYVVQVLALNSIRVGRSNPVRFRVDRARGA